MSSTILRVFASVAIVAAVSAASAGPIGEISDTMPVFMIEVAADGDSGSFGAMVGDGEYSDGTYSWALANEMPIMGQSGRQLATLGAGENSVFVNLDPVVSLNFSLRNNTNLPINVTVSGAVVVMNLDPAQGRASASITATDNDGNGATTSGAFAGPKSYEAFYFSGLSRFTFALLDDDLSAGAFSSDTDNEETPPSPNFSAIANTPVTSMSAQYSFTLSPQDSASGTGVFVIVPEPASLLLVGLGGLALIRRR